MNVPKTESGRQLWSSLPELYRTRDKGSGHLATYLDVYGELFDRFRRTLDQRLADCFPDSPEGGGLACQDWVLPYFADLLDVRMLSPHSEGRRAEVANAVTWRKNKGTVECVERISEGMSLQEVVVQEGWKRVATTPRMGFTMPSAVSLGAKQEPNAGIPSEAATHPGLPAVTIDTRKALRVVQTDASDPIAEFSSFHEEFAIWRTSNRSGVPCFPETFEDISRRTVDVRTPNWGRGHYHHKRVLLFHPPPGGFFDQSTIEKSGDDVEDATDGSRFFEVDSVRLFEQREGGDALHLWNPSLAEGAEEEDASVLTFLDFDSPLPTAGKVLIEDLNFVEEIKVTSGRLVLERVAAHRIVVDVADASEEVLVLEAKDCLIEEIEVIRGTVRLEHCTVLSKISCPRIQASDCIFSGGLTVTPEPNSEPGCIRFSRVPKDTANLFLDTLQNSSSNTEDTPVFHNFSTCLEGGDTESSLDFGSLGFGTLHPSTPDSICAGAEDGGEMGAFHHRRYCLTASSVIEKLQDFLPVGLEAVLIPDARLLAIPPTLKKSESVS